MAFNLQKVLLMSAAAAAVSTPALADDHQCTVASGYIFTDFGFLGSDKPVANCSTNFGTPFGVTGNVWVQVGEDEISNEIDLTFSTPSINFGPVELGATAGVFYTPELDDFTIPTASITASTNLVGFTVGTEYQWYWGDLEDKRFQVSVGRSFSLTEHVALDFEVGHVWIDSGDTPNFLVVGAPVTLDEQTIRPFGKFTWNGDQSESVFGISINW